MDDYSFILMGRDNQQLFDSEAVGPVFDIHIPSKTHQEYSDMQVRHHLIMVSFYWIARLNGNGSICL